MVYVISTGSTDQLIDVRDDSRTGFKSGCLNDSYVIFRIKIVISMIGLSEGLTHLATLAIYYLFKDDLGLTPSQVSLLFIVPAFPWFLKPIFALNTRKNTPILLGLRRKPYLLIFSGLQTIGFILLAYGVNGVIGAVLSLFIIGFSAAFCSAIAEALVVELSDGNKVEASEGITNFTIGKVRNASLPKHICLQAAGSMIVAYLSGYLLEKVTKKIIFLVTASFPFTIFLSSLYLIEQDWTKNRSVANQLLELIVFLKKRIIWGPSVFILAFMCGPDYDDALFFYYTNILGFNPSFMGTLRFTYGISSIAGVLLFKYKLQNTSYRKLLSITILASLPIYLSPILLLMGYTEKIGIPDKLFVLSGGFLNEAIAEIQLMPILVLVACICPEGLEGSAYSTLFAVRSFGSAISKASSAITMSSITLIYVRLVYCFIYSVFQITSNNFENLYKYIWLCGIFNLLPFIFFKLIPSEKEIEDEKIFRSKEKKPLITDTAS